MKKYILSFLMLVMTLCYAEEEIRVQLSTESPLLPLYLGKFTGDTDAKYLEELTGVLFFDLNYNGFTKIVPNSPQKESYVAALNNEVWKELGCAYVIKGSVINHRLTLSALSVATGSIKQFKELPLTGNLSQDRRVIHKVADALNKALFGVDGIATTRILYSAKTKNGSSWVAEIWEADWDGHNAKQITHEQSYSVTPVFIPSSDRFLYVSYKVGQPKIYIANIKEGVGRRLVDLRGNQLLPAISSNRDKIAFICDAGGRTDLFVQSFHHESGNAGKPEQLFSFPRATQASPTFSPDGSKIAFVSDKDGSPRVYIISATRGEKRATPTLISKQNRENSCPAWSPDGKKLAYSAKTKSERQIWVYDFDTDEERQLTEGPGHKENPSWALDSLHLVFNSADSASSELYIVNLNQPEAVKITRGSGKKHYPTWGAR